MQRIAFIILALFLAAPLARADEWSKTYTIQGKPELHIETSDANIRVDTWKKSEIEAHIVSARYKILDGHDLELREHQNGDRVEIRLRYPMHIGAFGFNYKDRRVDIEIHMPREGRMELETGDGHIQVANFKGAMELQSGDGNQDIDSVDGTLRARSGDGAIRAAGRFDELDLSTGDGKIDTRVLAGSKVASNWTLHTGDGNVRLQLPGDLAANLDMHTGDGHIDVDMPLSIEGRVSERNIHGRLNGGGNTLTIHTGDGSITLEKS
jgi:DUF4097 and DUF4098 domain-containing protein YvlB